MAPSHRSNVRNKAQRTKGRAVPASSSLNAFRPLPDSQRRFAEICPAARRHKVIRDNIEGISNHCIRRLARRGGVKRISGDVYAGTRRAMMDYMRRTLHDAVEIVKLRKKNGHGGIVMLKDILYALKRQGKTLIDGQWE